MISIEIFNLIFIFILGTIIGSFLNVVIYRFNTGRTIGGRSKCMSCGYQLRWYDLVPVFSWIFNLGKCRKCGSKISWQYPLVELGTGVVFAGLFLKYLDLFAYPLIFNIFFIFNALIFSILIVIFVYDIRHKIIPNELSYTFALLALAQTIVTIFFFDKPETLQLINYLDLFAGLIFFFPFWALWFFSRGRWIGLGDGKLVLGIGWTLGLVYGVSALVLAFWIGAIFSVVFLLIDRLKSRKENITMKTEIPFAPFLILGFLIEFFWKIDVIGLNLFF
jgi:leader peptidase (prepilin peptidase)/N-methyltransferase